MKLKVDIEQGDEVVEALAKSVRAMDSSRGVAWARFYEAERSHDEILRDLNVAREDVHLLSRFAAYVVGQLQGLKADHNVNLEYPGVLGFLPADELKRGRQSAESWLRARAERKPTERQKDRRVRADYRNLLMRQYGFPDEGALFSWLHEYETRRRYEPRTRRHMRKK